MNKEKIERQILELSISSLTKSIDSFIDACMVDGKPIEGTQRAIAQARACLPAGYKHSYTKQKVRD